MLVLTTLFNGLGIYNCNRSKTIFWVLNGHHSKTEQWVRKAAYLLYLFNGFAVFVTFPFFLLQNFVTQLKDLPCTQKAIKMSECLSNGKL